VEKRGVVGDERMIGTLQVGKGINSSPRAAAQRVPEPRGTVPCTVHSDVAYRIPEILPINFLRVPSE
jgi:hypothetical protein